MPDYDAGHDSAAEADDPLGYQSYLNKLISTNVKRMVGMAKSNLIDMSGLSGDPAEDERLDKLLFRLEWDIPASAPQNVIAVVFEPGESRGRWERLPTGSFYPENSEPDDQT